jgi:hypothetical protein
VVPTYIGRARAGGHRERRQMQSQVSGYAVPAMYAGDLYDEEDASLDEVRIALVVFFCSVSWHPL